MKLKLTLAETKILVLRALNLPADIEIEIRRNINPNRTPKARKDVIAMIGEIENLRYSTDQKIPAIKRFRETVPCGLAEAKWAVEHWNEVGEWLKKNKRIPLFDGNYDTGMFLK